MKKLKLILPFLFCFLFMYESGASYRETDFSPFPLSLKSEDLLSGYWQSEGSYLEIVEVKNHSINNHSWFIIYKVDPNDMSVQSISGYIFYDPTDGHYKRVFWTQDGVLIKPFTLYRLEDRKDEPSGEYCVHMNTYMLKMNEEMFVRTECNL